MTGFEDEYRVYEFGKDEFVCLEKEYAEKMGLREVSEEEQKDTSFLYVDEFISFFTNPPSECAGTPTGYLGSWNYPDIMESFRNKVARASAALYGFGCRPNGRKPVWAEMRDKYFNGKPYVDPDEMIGYLDEFDIREIIAFLHYCTIYKERFSDGIYGVFTMEGYIGRLLMRLKELCS